MKKKKVFLRFIFKFSLSLLLGLALCACQSAETPADGTEPTSNSGLTEEVPQEQKIVLASDGTSDFTVWIAEDLHSDGTLRDAVDELVKAIEEKTGAVIRVRKDVRATEEERRQPAILIGNTVFDESAELLLKNADSSIAYINNKIMLCAPDAKATAELVRSFVSRTVEPQTAEDKTLYFSAERDGYLSIGSYSIDSVLCCDVELINYRIVIPADADVNERTLANHLRRHLSTYYGYDFEIGSDAEKTEYEILIGDTVRSTQEVQEGYFAIKAQNGKLEIMACDMRGYEGLYEYVKKTLFKAGHEKDHVYEDGYSVTEKTENTLEDGTVFADTSYGDIRVMFYNIYSGSINNATPAVRIPFQKEILSTYLPDVFGLQEYKVARHGDLISYAKQLGYTEVPTARGDANCTPMFYRQDRLLLVKSGHLLYSGTDDATKGVTWAVFYDVSSNRSFAVFNTHMMYNRDGADLTAIRVENAKEMVELIASIQQQYPNVTIVMGGDLNSKIGSAPHAVLQSAGLSTAYTKARNKNTNSGHHSYPLYDTALGLFTEWKDVSSSYSNAIDHVYVSSNAQVKSFAFLVHYYTLWASDHMPVLVEIDLK